VGCHEISLREVSLVSWVGLERFLSFLQGLGANTDTRLTDVTWNVLMPLSCWRKEFRRVRILSVEVALYSINESKTVRRWSSVSDLVERIQNRTFNSETSSLRALGAFEILLKDELDSVNLRVHQDIRDNPDSEPHFWFLLSAFVKCVVDLSKVQVESMAVGALTSVQELMVRLESAAAAIQTLPGAEPLVLPQREALLEEIAAKHQELIDALTDVSERMGMVLLRYQAEARGIAALPETTSVLSELKSIVDSMHAFTSKADAFGSEVFAAIVPLSVGDALKKALSLVNAGNYIQDLGGRLTDAFFVGDPFAAESWETLEPELMKECDVVDAAVMNLIVEIQGFDAVRQVIEKRAKETDLWRQSLNGPEEFLGAREKVLATVSAKLVTEQERKAFELYFAHLTSFSSAAVDTSDVTFF
jgi:hypothetical protein